MKREWFCQGLKKKFETKMIMMGEDDDMAKEARVLNRIVRWHPRKGITYKDDPRHAEKPVVTQEQRVSIPSQRRLRRKREEKQRRRRRDKICKSAG